MNTTEALLQKIENYPFTSLGGDLRYCRDWIELKKLVLSAARPQPAATRSAVTDALIKRACEAEKRIGNNVWRGDGGSHIFIGLLIGELRAALESFAANRAVPADGVALIAAERGRQIHQEGWSPEHDDEHADGELAVAAACYATPSSYAVRQHLPPLMWPWEESWWKPTPDDRVRELVKAGALIAAEIDRLQRAAGAKVMTVKTDRASVEALAQNHHDCSAEAAAMLRALLAERDAALERAEKAEAEVARLRRAVERKNATLHTLRAVREDFCKPEWIEPIGNRLRESFAYTGDTHDEGREVMDPIRQQLADALRKADCTCVEIDSQLHTEYRKCSRCRALAAHDAESAGREQEARPVAENYDVGWLIRACTAYNDEIGRDRRKLADPNAMRKAILAAPPPPSAPASVPVSDKVRALPAKWRKECPLTHHHFTRELEAALAGSAGDAQGEKHA